MLQQIWCPADTHACHLVVKTVQLTQFVHACQAADCEASIPTISALSSLQNIGVPAINFNPIAIMCNFHDLMAGIFVTASITSIILTIMQSGLSMESLVKESREMKKMTSALTRNIEREFGNLSDSRVLKIPAKPAPGMRKKRRSEAAWYKALPVDVHNRS